MIFIPHTQTIKEHFRSLPDEEKMRRIRAEMESKRAELRHVHDSKTKTPREESDKANALHKIRFELIELEKVLQNRDFNKFEDYL